MLCRWGPAILTALHVESTNWNSFFSLFFFVSPLFSGTGFYIFLWCCGLMGKSKGRSKRHVLQGKSLNLNCIFFYFQCWMLCYITSYFSLLKFPCVLLFELWIMNSLSWHYYGNVAILFIWGQVQWLLRHGATTRVTWIIIIIIMNDDDNKNSNLS